MKKFTLMLLAMLCIGSSANAVTREYTIVNSVSSEPVVIDGDVLASFVTGNTLRVYCTVPGEGGNFYLGLKENASVEDWNATALPSLGSEKYPWIGSGGTYKDITFSDDDITAFSTKAIYIKSGSATLSKVTYFKDATPSTTTELWTGTQILNWNADPVQAVDDDKLGSTYLKVAKLNDIIRITYKDATSDNAIWIVNKNGWSALPSGAGQFSNVTTGSGTVEYQITDVTVLETIQQNGIVVSGVNATVTKVELLTFTDSYDAVSVTITSTGIATFSNPSKNVQISDCSAVRAYYVNTVEKAKVYLEELTCIPANQGVILKGTPGVYAVKVGATGWIDISATNLLKPTGSENVNVAASVSGKYHYILARNNSTDEVGFFNLTTDHVLGTYKAYLETTTDLSARAALIFDDDEETTGISTTLVNNEKMDNNYYDLMGRKVSQPTRGLYIVNGKKVIVK